LINTFRKNVGIIQFVVYLFGVFSPQRLKELDGGNIPHFTKYMYSCVTHQAAILFKTVLPLKLLLILVCCRFSEQKSIPKAMLDTLL